MFNSANTRSARNFPVVLCGLLFSLSIQALEPIYTSLFSDVAIKGYDTVAYFTQNKPVKGKAELVVKYQGAQWWFSSAENKQLFKSDPQKYAPQYGGYCAYAVSQNTTASIKPELFTIHQDKLYLNYNKSVNKKWLASRAQFIIDADKYWPGLINK